MRGTRLGVAALVLCLGLIGCGPVEYLNQVTRRAATAFAAAQKVDAEKLAPYEYYTAQEFLHKSREVAGYARYQVAIDYGRRAEEAALKARALSLEKKGQPGGAEPTAPVAPAAPEGGAR
ncbi:MAG TPA: hypothetical protein VGQ83_30440 [Polyangia bacterium]|jgi:hypothetical protein